MPRPRLRIGDRGEINLTETGRGKWVARVKVRDSDGRIRFVKATGTSKGAAKRALEDRLASRSGPPATSDVRPGMSVGQLADYWLEHRTRHGKARSSGPIAPQTLAAYNDAITYVVRPTLGDLRLDETTVGILDRMLSTVESGADGGRSRDKTPGRSTAQARTVLSQMFDLAVRHGAIPTNPMKLVESSSRPTRGGRGVDHLSLIQARSLRRTVRRDQVRVPGRRMPNPDLEDWVDVALGTGARDGEILALRWMDLRLDVEPPTAHICGTLVEPRGDFVKRLHRQDETKSRSERTLILPAHAVDVIRSRATRSAATDPTDPVFATRLGNWMSPANIRTRLRRAVEQDVDLRGTSPHTLRRTVGTLVAHEAGLDAARDQLGHSDPSVTFQHYVGRRTLGPDLRPILDQFFTDSDAG